MAAIRRPRRGPRPKRNHWVFTSYEAKLPEKYNPDIVRYICYQRETCPRTQKLHYQGYIECFDPKRLKQIQKIIEDVAAHCEARKGSRHEARAYCHKVETAIPDTFFEFGTWRQDTNRKRKLVDMLKSDMTLEELIVEAPDYYVRCFRGLNALYQHRQKKKAKEFRKLEVLVYWGATGTGKTRKAISFPDHYKMPLTGNKVWYDGYNGEDTLIIDDFHGGIKYTDFLNILDGYELQCPVKGSFVWALWNRVIITSNKPPKDWYQVGLTPELDRRITEVIHFIDPNAPAAQSPSY